MFYSIDGVDGAGKSVQIKLLCEFLSNRGEKVVLCRDPGSTFLSEELRKIILHRDDLPTGRLAQMFLFMAARAQLVEEVIAPALAAGQTVVCDRFLLSSVVYQGYAGGLDPQLIYNVGLAATRGLVPDKTFVLDVPQEIAASRMTNRELDSIEREDAEFKQRLRDGFSAEAKKRPKSIILIDGLQSIEDVHAEIVRHL